MKAIRRYTGRRGVILRLLFSLLAAGAALAVCSKSSFLYPLNDWVDVNCFFTVGRGMLHGLVPYRDLYEQKGPLVYFLYALAAAISEHSFTGVWLIECLCFSCFVYLSGKIAEMMSGLRGVFWPGAALTAVLVPVTPAFSHGGSAEELFLPVLALGLGLVLRALTEKRCLTDGEGTALGICTAAALWTKYTFCGLFAGMGLVMLAWYIRRGHAGKLPGLICRFLAGALGLSALAAGYFALNGAAGDLWQAYFVNNLTAYSRNIRSGAYDPPLQNLLNNLPWSVPGALGLAWLAATGRKRGWEAAAAGFGAAGLFVFTYLNGRRYPYYALVMAVFTPLGLAAIFRGIRRLMKNRERLLRGTGAVLTALVLAASPAVCFMLSGNTYLMKIPKEDTPQYRFAEIIRQEENPTLLNYGFLDGGFYFASGVLPETPYFCTLNISLKEMENALKRSVRQGETMFVVTRSRELDREAPYTLAGEASMVFEGRKWTYYLYRLKENAETGSPAAHLHARMDVTHFKFILGLRE